MTGPTLNFEQAKALSLLGDIPSGSAYVPTADQRPYFQELVGLGLAKSRGPGLGGEGFAPTPAGRKAFSAQKPKGRRGFAGMSPERRLEAARKGGLSVPAEKRAFSTNRDLASRAGVKGGEVSGGSKRKREGEDG